MTAPRIVLNYFRAKMLAAGYEVRFGYQEPEFGTYPRDKTIILLFLTDASHNTWENSEYPIEIQDNLEAYVIRNANNEREGEWYDDVHNALEALVHNPQDRDGAQYLWWEHQSIREDRMSPLKRWNNNTSYSDGFLVARIDVPITYYRHIPELT